MTKKMVYPESLRLNLQAAKSPEVGQIDGKQVPRKEGKLKTIAAPNGQERRKRPRTRMSLSARLRATDPKDGNLVQIVRTLNSSRDGFYFSVPKLQFSERMRLRIVFPYVSAHDSMPATEDFGRIVRVDHLPDGSLGIAIVLLASEHAEQYCSEAPQTRRLAESEERRVSTRHPFSATATVFDTQSGARVTARCSDLSLSGCYVDTINPFTEKARVQLRLTVGKNSFETEGRVVFRELNFGMGLVFCDLTPEQELTLLQWLEGSATEKDSEPNANTPKPKASEGAGLTDRALALRLIHLLRSKGNLREAEVSILLSKHLATDEEVANRPCSDRL
jgi:PilZ domain-containing protein